LASLADIYVNDGFGQNHREYASFCAITEFLPSYAGCLVEKEIKQLSKLLTPEKPFIAIVAGAKPDKIAALKLLTKKADNILVGGVLANTFLKAKGYNIGSSKFDKETFDDAKQIIELAGKKLMLPEDVIIADKFDNEAETKTVSIKEIPKEWISMDIGPETIKNYKEQLKTAKTILWVGPLGVFEIEKFSNGTKQIGNFLSTLKAIVIVGGGDSSAAIQGFDLADKMTHVSIGGGASLEFIEKEGKLPALLALEDYYKKSKEE
jgi:phosphoglycerate kinase